MRIRVGILGTGWAGRSHAAAYARLPDVEVAGLWNRTKSRAESLASELGSPDLTVYDDWQTLISRGDCDVISIATAPMLRGEPLVAAVEQGHHVLVEKPMSVGVPEAQLMAAAAERAHTVTACCLNWRYAPAYRAARRAIGAGQIGAVREVRTEWYVRWNRQFFRERPWAATLRVTNGALGEGLTHDVDKVRYLTGQEFSSVVSRVRSVTIKHDEDFLVEAGRSLHIAELDGGIMAQLALSLSAGEDRWSMMVVGDEGSLRIPDAGTVLVRQRHDDDEPVDLDLPDAFMPDPGIDLLQHTWNSLIEDFVAAVREGDRSHGGHPDLPTLTDGLRSEEVIAAVRESDGTGRWVPVGA